ncbi:MAG: ParB/RepB/Spo0J family partition protein [Patescibacteria group bacterium]|jgi:ParB family chromosome partitioning protein|nr:ParB/RepB/Spo0J family partition protein [Patescibacteria group bacterium]MDD5172900.1 ParB/RepB/Spo0J family partition protein [Patescibacteria group bacterium]
MALGRGLGSLIPAMTIKRANEEILVETGEQVLQIPVNQIDPNPEQPRKNFSRLEMEELMNSIKEYGIIQPLILIKNNSRYQIIAGERRWRAAKILDFITVPAIVRSIKDNDKLAISLLENIQRKDLNPMEKARGYQRLMDEFNLNQEEISRKIGKSRASIANTLRILTLPEEIQAAINEEKITESHAKALLSADGEEKQKSLLKRILGLGLTVRETERIIEGKKIRKRIELDTNILDKENILSKLLGTKVKIIKRNKKIKVVIELYQDKELDGLIKKIIKNE